MARFESTMLLSEGEGLPMIKGSLVVCFRFVEPLPAFIIECQVVQTSDQSKVAARQHRLIGFHRLSVHYLRLRELRLQFIDGAQLGNCSQDAPCARFPGLHLGREPFSLCWRIGMREELDHHRLDVGRGRSVDRVEFGDIEPSAFDSDHPADSATDAIGPVLAPLGEDAECRAIPYCFSPLYPLPRSTARYHPRSFSLVQLLRKSHAGSLSYKAV